jgi:hypothetical protein
MNRALLAAISAGYKHALVDAEANAAASAPAAPNSWIGPASDKASCDQ